MYVYYLLSIIFISFFGKTIYMRTYHQKHCVYIAYNEPNLVFNYRIWKSIIAEIRAYFLFFPGNAGGEY